jgi:TonB family protein
VLHLGDAQDRGEPLLAFDRTDLPDYDHHEPPFPRAAAGAAMPEREPPVGSGSRTRPFGPLGSLLLHLLPLLLLLDWPMHPPAEVIPIPVRLVLEPPPVAPPKTEPKPAPPKPEAKPPKGRIASEDIGGSEAKGADETKAQPAPQPKPPTAPEAPRQEALAVPPPLPEPAPKPETVEPPSEHFARPQPKPKPAPPHPPRARGQAHLLLLPRPGRFPGPAATRDEYLAYIASLTRRHLDLLPLSLVGARRGETVIDVLVLDDGTVAMLRVGRSSGYPDIDERIERMISAVGRFPPLPQWFQGPSMQLEFRLRFPEALQN